MKAIFISDTHGQHEKLELPEGDILFHCGDVSKAGTEEEIKDFLEWFKNLDFKYKVFIAGNHDFYFENESEEKVNSIIPENIIYLNDSGINIEGINIWGSPIQPWFFNWAFNRQRGEEINHHWELIPDNTDILLTHGPPHLILDKTKKGLNVGCEDLLRKTKNVQPKIHAFGHIHEAYGIEENLGCTFINASVLSFKYKLRNAPIILEI